MFHSKTGIQSQAFDAKLNHGVKMFCHAELQTLWWDTVSRPLIILISCICFHSVLSLSPLIGSFLKQIPYCRQLTTAQQFNVLLSVMWAGQSTLPSRILRNQRFEVVNWSQLISAISINLHLEMKVQGPRGTLTCLRSHSSLGANRVRTG